MSEKKRSKRRLLSPEDEALWIHVTQTVRRVQTDILPSASMDQALENEKADKTKQAKPKAKKVIFTPPPPAPRTPPHIPKMTHGITAGMDKRTAQRLKRGKLDIEGKLDLHGLTQKKAHQILSQFLHTGFDTGRRTVLVITGKGDHLGGRPGVLKQVVPEWFNEMPMRQWVAGFSYAAPKDGGNGALYVRLKRRREKT